MPDIGFTPGTERHVWTANYAEVTIYAEDASGNPGANPILDYCYARDIRVTGKLSTKLVSATGRKSEKILPGGWNYNARIAIFYINKPTELDLTNVFNREKRLRFVFSLVDNEYTGIAPQQNDTHTLTAVVADNFNFQAADNQEVILDTNFLGEDFF